MEQRNPTSLFITLFIIAAAFFFLDRGGFLAVPRSLFETILTGPSRNLHSAAIFFPFTSAQVKKLTDERNDLQSKLVDFEKIKKENDDLRLQLGIVHSSSGKEILLAHVLSSSHLFIIDKGADDGLKEGQSVVFKNIFIGKIVSVSKKTSRVLLPIEDESILAGKTLGSGALGLVKGKGGQATLSEVILSENLSAGDTVITTGSVNEEGIGIAPGLIVGKIEQMRKSDNGLYQEALLMPLIDYTSLTNVFIPF